MVMEDREVRSRKEAAADCHTCVSCLDCELVLAHHDRLERGAFFFLGYF